jgi:ATP-dependent DNA helicase RecG
MFADASDIPADARILDGFKWHDLDKASVRGFRNRFASTKPAHPWLALSDRSLLEKLGAWRKDNHDGKEGLTLAGMLMFGKHDAIVNPGAAPTYVVDYRDFRGRGGAADRWSDRLFPDGTWEANLFQFYERCGLRLVVDLKVPFTLRAGQRIDETPVHVALREALVNALIHTDYSVGGGIVIEHYEDQYLFSNPGTLLISEAQLRRGGVSECRNKSLQGAVPGLVGIGGGVISGLI